MNYRLLLKALNWELASCVKGINSLKRVTCIFGERGILCRSDTQTVLTKCLKPQNFSPTALFQVNFKRVAQ